MDIKTQGINLNLVYEENILSIVQQKIGEFRSKIIDRWSESQPIITQFPDVVAVIEPVKQFSCTAEQKRVILANQELSVFTARDLESLLRLSISFNEMVGMRLKAYGFNYQFIVTPSDSSESDSLLEKSKEMVKLSLFGVDPDNLISGGVKIAYKSNGNKVAIEMNPTLDADVKKQVGMDIRVNVHFYNDTLDTYSKLEQKYREHHDTMSAKITAMFAPPEASEEEPTPEATPEGEAPAAEEMSTKGGTN